MGPAMLSLLLLLCGTAFANLTSQYPNKASLHADYTVYWKHNATTDMMHIATEVKTDGWVAFGFTKEKSSNMKGYDVCIGYVSGGSKVIKDYLTDGHKAPDEDSQNDCMLDEAMESGGTTTLKYHRKVNTSDSKDVPIEKGNIITVWAYKKGEDMLTSKHTDRGFKELTMISSAQNSNQSSAQSSTQSSTRQSSAQASKLRGIYWKCALPLFAVVSAVILK